MRYFVTPTAAREFLRIVAVPDTPAAVGEAQRILSDVCDGSRLIREETAGEMRRGTARVEGQGWLFDLYIAFGNRAEGESAQLVRVRLKRRARGKH